MSAMYNTAVVCPFLNQNCDPNVDTVLTLDPELSDRMSESTNFEELKYMWEQWHDKSGKNMREDYKTYVDLMNKAARVNGWLMTNKKLNKSNKLIISSIL